MRPYLTLSVNIFRLHDPLDCLPQQCACTGGGEGGRGQGETQAGARWTASQRAVRLHRGQHRGGGRRGL